MPTANARINMRVTEATRDLISDAAEAEGTDLTGFIVSAATNRARRVLLEERALRVSPNEAAQIKRMLEEDREPTPALKRAMERLASSEL